MESVKLFYCVKLCDETDCFEKHIKKIYEIQDHIKECFKAHVNRDRYRVFSQIFWNEATVSEATHVQYLNSDGFIYIVSFDSKDALPTNKVVNFRLLSISKWHHLYTDVKPFELSLGAKSFLKFYTRHLIK